MKTTFNYELINEKARAYLEAQDELQKETVDEIVRLMTYVIHCIKTLPKNPDQVVVDVLDEAKMVCNVGGENTNLVKETGRVNLSRQKKRERLRHLIKNNPGPFTRKDLKNYFNYKSFTSISDVVDSFVKEDILTVFRNKNVQGAGGRYEYIVK